MGLYNGDNVNPPETCLRLKKTNTKNLLPKWAFTTE